MTGQPPLGEAPRGRSIAARLTGLVREFGLGISALYLIDRALHLLPGRCGLHVYEFLEQPITDKPLLPARLARDITFREIGPTDSEVQRMPARPEVKQARYTHGSRCLGVWRRDDLLGYLWFSEREHDEDEVRCRYLLPAPRVGGEPDTIFDFDLYLFPEHRMGIGFVALWHAASAYLRARGVGSSYSRMTRFNLASRRAHLRLGSRVAGRAVFLCLGRFEAMLSTLRPYAACGWSRRVWLRLPAGPPASDAPDAAT